MEAKSKAEENQARRARLRKLVVPALSLVTSLTSVAVLWRSQGMIDSRPDPYWFSAMAESLLRGEGFSQFGALLHRRTPGYPFFIAGLYSLFGVHLLAVQLAQCLLFVGTACFVQDIGRRVYSERVGLIAGLLCAVHPALLRYVPDLHLETLLTFLFTFSVWLSCRFNEKATLGRGAALGVVWGLATLTKAVVLLYPAVFSVLWWLGQRRKQAGAQREGLVRQLMPLAVTALAMALTIAPWTARNYAVTGHFVPVTTGLSDAVLRSYVFSRTEFITLQKPPYTDAENEVNNMFRAMCRAQGTIWEKDDLETDRILNQAAKEKVLASPGAFAKKTFIGIFTFWYQMTSLKNSLAAGGMALIAWIFAAIGLRRSWVERQPVWLVLAPIVYLNLFLAALLSLGRYSVPVTPCLLVLAAFGVHVVLGFRRSKLTGATAPR